MMREFHVPPDSAAERIDRWLVDVTGESRATIQKYCRAGQVTVNDVPVKANYRPVRGDIVRLPEPAVRETVLRAEAIPLEIVYEDEDMLVINKPRGMVVHPAAGHDDGTLVHALLAHTGGCLADAGDPLRPGIVHRLDRDTSGLLAAAKSERGYESLSAQVRAHSMERIYFALVHGEPEADRGTIRLPLGRDPRNRLRRAVVSQGGRDAVTHFTVAERLGKFALVRCRLETGRTHQIRVHMAAIGHPVVQDPLYGRRKDAFPLAGQALHAARLTLRRPADGSEIICEAPLPADFLQCLAAIRKENSHVEK